MRRKTFCSSVNDGSPTVRPHLAKILKSCPKTFEFGKCCQLNDNFRFCIGKHHVLVNRVSPWTLMKTITIRRPRMRKSLSTASLSRIITWSERIGWSTCLSESNIVNISA